MLKKVLNLKIEWCFNMLFKDKYNLKYKTLKHDNKYYLVSVNRGNKNNVCYKVQVSGKENVFKYIRNNNLTVIKEDEENES